MGSTKLQAGPPFVARLHEARDCPLLVYRLCSPVYSLFGRLPVGVFF